jgi:formylglycine-generating enzyme required for sulfatase activity
MQVEHGLEPEMILIRAGWFLMGSDRQKDRHAFQDEKPQHKLRLPDYYLARTPVTNAQYLAFVQASGHETPMHWKGGEFPNGKQDHPVVYVSWHDAVAYCRWLAELTGNPYRLPSEAEREKGARGSDGRIFPWGNRWHAKRCNSKENGPGDTTAVEIYAKGTSPYGLLDMVGNVWEWTSSQLRGYPYRAGDGRESMSSTAARVVRGGSFGASRAGVRCAARGRYDPHLRFDYVGFRVAAGAGTGTGNSGHRGGT